ncbi:hypothetical protein L6270_04990 [Candidatus Parcubacteria bacterium]|nr:hypothetical protein [Patescibacteria group bacterium]MBU4309317.1 hypothetical protein [Patescibacteria group bacterium]MBU4432294.1 hypothetical protein [Patescibacteria group bacterium]MBU4577678.1 hypothetical protein [Patescibacteria group bacterium]MCG2697364.1 hypothetical protein [Candidatus Parcubacteria bacterium]
MFNFTYNKQIDEECWQRIIKAGVLFGHFFPQEYHITDRGTVKARERAVLYREVWDEMGDDFMAGIKKIYKIEFPNDVKCFVNTSPYSMDGYPSGHISISMNFTNREKIKGVIVHESAHYIFRKYYYDFCKKIGCSHDDFEEIKEVITVINQDVFSDIWEPGWDVHKKYREKTLALWRSGLDIEGIVQLIKEMINEKK